MEAQSDLAAREVKHLQRCINDLVSLLALPAVWSGGDPSQVLHTLLDALMRMLRLDLISVRLTDPAGEAPVEFVQFAVPRGPTPSAHEVCIALSQCCKNHSPKWPPLLRNAMGEGAASIVSLPLGLQGEMGVIFAAAERPDFPLRTESLLLSVAANQASIGVQEAWLLRHQKRVAAELDQRVAQRTAELAAANQALKKELVERRQVEEALSKARSALSQVTRVTSLGVLTASIAHEVNQPLSGIVTNASTCLRMLAGDPPNVEGARETARRTIRDANRASEVITRLRALFGKKEPVIELVDLNEATREVIALSLTELQRNRVILQPELAGDLPLVAGDRVQLQQVILNLLRNASDAMKSVNDRPRHLLIRTEPIDDDRVCFSVTDVGVGFEPQAADKLFEAFYTTKDEGMGIGLSVSRSIIDRHHGRLWAAPNSGPGVTFSFAIPRTRPGLMGDNISARRLPSASDAA